MGMDTGRQMEVQMKTHGCSFQIAVFSGKQKQRERMGQLRVICNIKYSCEMAKKPQKDSLGQYNITGQDTCEFHIWYCK